MNTTPLIVDLEGLSEQLQLSVKWLKEERKAGRIPFLKAGQKYRFNVEAVKRSLAERAAGDGGGS